MEGVLMKFGEALDVMIMGGSVARDGWNGKGIFIKLQNPDEKSKMTGPYIYIDTMGLETNNRKAPRLLVPWVASQTDILAADWMILTYDDNDSFVKTEDWEVIK